MTLEIKESADVALKRAELDARRDRDERVERVATIAALILAAIGMQAMGAPESVVGGAIGAAVALAVPGGNRSRAMLASGAGAIIGAIAGGWMPGVGA